MFLFLVEVHSVLFGVQPFLHCHRLGMLMYKDRKQIFIILFGLARYETKRLYVTSYQGGSEWQKSFGDIFYTYTNLHHVYETL